MPAAKVLIVEDEWLIAEDLKSRLEALGLEVLGPAPSCSAALEILWSEPPDLAFIDTELGSETCEVVLEECEQLGVPVVISTGHTMQMLPDYCREFPVLTKPYGDEAIAAMLSARAIPLPSHL